MVTFLSALGVESDKVSSDSGDKGFLVPLLNRFVGLRGGLRR